MNEFPTLFSPIQIGSLALRNRVITPPHSSAIGNLWGTDRDAEQAIAYLKSRADAGVSWTTIQGRLGNLLIPGFEPSGVSAEVLGHYRSRCISSACRATSKRCTPLAPSRHSNSR